LIASIKFSEDKGSTMANDSRRGYLSGILQRGSRPLGQAHSASSLLPLRETLSQPGPQSFFNAPAEIETQVEASSPTKITEAEESFNQPERLSHPDPHPREPIQQGANTHSDETRPETEVTIKATARDLLNPSGRVGDLPSEKASPFTRKSTDRAFLAQYSTPTGVTHEQQSTEVSRQSSARLVGMEEAGEDAVTDDSVPRLDEERASISSMERTEQIFKSGKSSDSSVKESLERARHSVSPRPRTSLPIELDAQPERNSAEDERARIRNRSSSDESSSDNQTAIRLKLKSGESVESVQASLRGETLMPVENSQSRTSITPRQPLQEESKQGARATESKGVSTSPASFTQQGQFVQPPSSTDSIEDRRQALSVHTQAQTRAEVFVAYAANPAQSEGRSSRGASDNQNQPPHEESPKLTINRLDVQIINQSPGPALLPPRPPAPAQQQDTLDALDRYQLGHLNLIF
jgi:hypothetical protein